MTNLESTILAGTPNYNIQLDPGACIFGTWLHSEKAERVAKEHPNVEEWVEELHRPHELLHASARRVNNALRNGNAQRAQSIFNNQTSIHAQNTLKQLDTIINWSNQRLAAMDKADSIYNAVTLPTIDKLSNLFNQIDEITEQEI
jgi:Na+/phosphate symporter